MSVTDQEETDRLAGLRNAWTFWCACKADASSRETGAWGDAQDWLTDELHQLFETGPYENSPQ